MYHFALSINITIYWLLTGLLEQICDPDALRANVADPQRLLNTSNLVLDVEAVPIQVCAKAAKIQTFDNLAPVMTGEQSSVLKLWGVSSIDPSVGLIVSRPYGGVAVLWRNSLASFVKPLTFDDDRIIGLECIIHDVKFLFLGVYLPYNYRQNFDRYVCTLPL